LAQLRSTGILETVSIRRQGYSHRIFFEEFVKRSVSLAVHVVHPVCLCALEDWFSSQDPSQSFSLNMQLLLIAAVIYSFKCCIYITADDSIIGQADIWSHFFKKKFIYILYYKFLSRKFSGYSRVVTEASHTLEGLNVPLFPSHS
jgi:hypothetical protein